MSARFSPPPPSRFTEAEYLAMHRAGAFAAIGRVELRDGHVVKRSAVHLPHARMSKKILRALEYGVSAAGLALQVDFEISVSFGRGFQPTCDLVVWDPEGVSADLDGPLPASAVRLVVEVADSSLGDDLGDKLVNYARCGVPEYWVVDVKGGLIFQHAQPDGDSYRKREVRRFGEATLALTIPLELTIAAD